MKATALLGAVLALAGCGGGGAQRNATEHATAARSMAAATPAWLPNGRSIFLTGKDASGTQITASKPPLRPSCAACHRPDGSGGVHLPGGAVSADLRHKALVTDQKHPYTLALLQRAISTGTDNEGKPLSPVMPHWRMPKRDLHDVAQYVLTQLR